MSHSSSSHQERPGQGFCSPEEGFQESQVSLSTNKVMIRRRQLQIGQRAATAAVSCKVSRAVEV